MTTTPVPAKDGLPFATTPLRRVAPPEGNALHQGTFDRAELDVLDAYRQEAGLSYGELWLRYFELGGMNTRTDVEAILCGALATSDEDHDVIALALNERFAELGRDHPVSYATE